MTTLHRRQFLSAAGIYLALPLLESQRSAAATTQKRLVTIANPFGMIPEGFFPEKPGRLRKLPYLLQPLEAQRNQITLFSNLDHGVSGGHKACHSFLTGMLDVEARNWPERNISLDQRAAEHMGPETRFPSLVLSSGGLNVGEQELRLSWTRNGVNVPPITTTRRLFDKLFKADDPTSRQTRAKSYRLHDSILDSVRDQARHLEQRLGAGDRDKLDEYFTSIRETERKLEQAERWLHEPKPCPPIDRPQDRTFTETLPMFLDLMVLALQTDSTRVATLGIPSTMRVSDLGLEGDYHAISHHGQKPELKNALTKIETFQMAQLARFLERLRATKDREGVPLLDSTTVLFGSGLGNGATHSNRNLPILLAGGGLQSHGQHVAMPTSDAQRVPLSNLYTSLLQNFGVEIDSFSKASGNLNQWI